MKDKIMTAQNDTGAPEEEIQINSNTEEMNKFGRLLMTSLATMYQHRQAGELDGDKHYLFPNGINDFELTVSFGSGIQITVKAQGA